MVKCHVLIDSWSYIPSNVLSYVPQTVSAKSMFQVDDLEESNERHLQILSTQHLRNLQAIDNQHKVHIQAIQDKHDERMQAFEETGKPFATLEALQNCEDMRRGELRDYNKKVEELERKNTDLETKHEKTLLMQDKVIDRQDNQIRYQKQLIQDMGEEQLRQQKLKEMEVKALKMQINDMETVVVKQDMEVNELKLGVKEMKNMMEVGVEQLREQKELEVKEMMEVEAEIHNTKVHKLEEEKNKFEEDIRVLQSQVKHVTED